MFSIPSGDFPRRIMPARHRRYNGGAARFRHFFVGEQARSWSSRLRRSTPARAAGTDRAVGSARATRATRATRVLAMGGVLYGAFGRGTLLPADREPGHCPRRVAGDLRAR
jgi:hypothetical protein